MEAFSASPTSVLADGIHPNGFGHQVVATNILAFLAGTPVARPVRHAYPYDYTDGTHRFWQDDVGMAHQLDNLPTGTTAGSLVQLDSQARLPAVDGSQLTNLPSTGGGFALHNVTTNAAKLALPANTAAGYEVQITGEGNRIEQYLGGGVNADANWLVMRNMVNLTVDNEDYDVAQHTVNGVAIPYGTVTNVGWCDPLENLF